ncbi:HelD family protein, partial [Streptomyces phyllanthi]|uniref:HelD family protein n=1 Tax=Streptomyces phyllanthi TaxID=1803180 RepID=UPI0031EA3A48
MSKRARRADVLAEEQRAVDHAYHCLERARQRAEALKGVGAAASGKDAIDLKSAWQRELAALDLGRNALVFMRADVDEGNGRETFYIGRRSVFDTEQNAAVISWSSEAAVRWRLTSEQEPGDVRLLRQIVCDEQLVKRYFDLHGTGAAARPYETVQEALETREPQTPQTPETSESPEPPEGAAPSQPAEAGQAIDDGDEQAGKSAEQEWRDHLLDELDRARDGAMHDIVETIQRDQLRLVTEEPDGVLIVQGGPGTGKTAVGMHRVSWLLDNNHVAADNMLVVGPNRGFLEYARSALVELGNGGVTMLELPALWSGATARRDPGPVALVKSDARMSLVLQRAVDNQTITGVERLEALVGGPVFTFELRRREVVVPVAELARIAEDALAGDSPYRVRQERCAQRIVQHLTQAYLSLLPGPADTDYFTEIRRSRPVTRLLRRMAPELTAREALRKLLSSAATLSAAADGVLTSAEQSQLTTYHEAAARDASLREPSLEDLVCLDELEHVLSGRPERTYGHLVVDEAQELTPMQARSLARRCPSGSMTILGDLAQATGPFPYEDWEQLGTALAGRGGRRLAELLTGFRVPGEVMDFVRPLGAHCAPGIAVPTSVRRTGTGVAVSEGADPAVRAAEHARNLAGGPGRPGGFGGPGGPDGTAAGRTVAVIVPTAPHWRETVATAVAEHASISVLTAHEVKGLEFDHVVVVEPSV